ncbi:hypothetical protein JYU34_018819 [Plutella xylostella]|uniref:Uncharacterized protein n=1 Tax=Plutella xylostella TaxID=51655 RepID=A0ABQ7PYJ0_PLUXY|nr:hypothetical protein JYU34_018819 [Plutella xylostella]
MIRVETLFLPQPFSISFEDNAEFKIDVPINEDDYEMIDLRHVAKVDISDKLQELKKIASMEYARTQGGGRIIREWLAGTEPTVASEFTIELTHKNPLNKRELDSKTEEEVYNYIQLLEDYYEDAVQEAAANGSYHPGSQDKSESNLMHVLKQLVNFDTDTRNCTEEEIKNIGIKALNCIYQESVNQTEDPTLLAERFGRIVKIWFFVYVAVAVPLWCTKGWCCCCLFCELCRPRARIARCRRYLAAHPPGALRTPRGHLAYQPTAAELDAHAEFEHAVRMV